MKKLLVLTLAILMLFTLVLSGCAETKDESVDKADDKADEKKEETKTEDVKEAETEPVDIEIMMNPWVSTPPGDIDPYKDWLDETFNANFTLTTSTEFATEILTRFAAGTPPDIIESDYEILITLYDQDVLVGDWTPYLSKMPSVSIGMGDAAKLYYTRNDKLITLTNPPGGQLWTWNIRKDWLTALGLDMPTTPDELLDVGRAFTINDPDGNGEADTYGFTSSGGGNTIGEIGNLKLMYGPTNFYVADDGTVQHFVTDGNEKLFLEFLKIAVDEELIDPDWYSQGWNDRKPNLFKGMFGLAWYPPMALLNETETARESDHAVIDWYDVLIPMPTASADGGKQLPTGVKGGIKTVSAMAEQDTAKFDVILNFFEGTSYPNDGYFKIRWGVDVDAVERIDLEGGYVYINNVGTEDTIRGKDGNDLWLYNWGKLIAVQGKDNVLTGALPTPGKKEEVVVEMQTKYINDEFYPTDYQLLALDLDATTETQRILDEFEINYILGNDMDYDAFVQRWLASGGQALIDEATEQFKEMGIIK